MKRVEILRRAVACEAGLDATRIRDRLLSPTEKIRLKEATARLEHLPLRIDETPRITIEEVAAATRAMAEEMPYRHGVPLGMIVVDYIQRLEPSRHLQQRDKHEQHAHATRSLKILAQELDIIALELAQQKDPPPGKKPTRPTLTPCCIAESGQIQKESDDVIFIHPEDDPKHTPVQTVTLIVAKQRAGAKGDVPMTFQRDQYRLIDHNAPDPTANPSRQYLDPHPERAAEPPQRPLYGDDGESYFTEGL
jgi:replicative DNA helicase